MATACLMRRREDGGKLSGQTKRCDRSLTDLLSIINYNTSETPFFNLPQMTNPITVDIQFPFQFPVQIPFNGIMKTIAEKHLKEVCAVQQLTTPQEELSKITKVKASSVQVTRENNPMASTDVIRTTVSEDGGKWSDPTKRHDHQLTELLSIINRKVSEIPLFNFGNIDDSTCPPLPQMTNLTIVNVNFQLPFKFPVQFPFNDIIKIAEQQLKQQYAVQQLTTPQEELRKIKEGGHICFSAPAGSGKTTLLRVIARYSVTGKHKFEKIEHVHIIPSGPVERASECLARDVIFPSKTYDAQNDFSAKASKKLFNYAKKYPNKFLLLIDSLDTLPEELNEVNDPPERYSPQKKYAPLVHIKMLLNGKLLKGCRIVTSSRPHAIRNFKQDLIPTRSVSLLGFSRDDALKVLELYSDNAKEIFELVDGNPHLFSLFKEPIFLVYLVEIWPSLKAYDRRIRATDVMMEVVKCFHYGDHAKGNYDKLKNMQKLAREMLWLKKIEFNEVNLNKYDLSLKDLTDLCRNTSDKTAHQVFLRLVTGKSRFIFSHQSIQEMFAAVDVAELDLETFKGVVGKIHEPFFFKTRDLIYGLLFGRFGHDESEFPKMCEKRVKLKEDIESKLLNAVSPQEQLSIFETLTEAITDVGQFNLRTHGVYLNGIPMNDWSLYCTGIATTQFTMLNALHLEQCGIQRSHLLALKDGICQFESRNSKVRIISFSLRNNPDIGKENRAVTIACEIVKMCEVGDFNIGACGLNSDHMLEMHEKLCGFPLKTLGLEFNQIKKKGMEVAGRLVKECGIKEINLSECATTFKEAESFGKSARGSEIHQLIAVEKTKPSIVGGYGNVVRTCNLHTLVISFLQLTPEDASRIAKSSSDGKVSQLHCMAVGLKINALGQVLVPPIEATTASIENLLTVVKDEIILHFSVESKLSEMLQRLLDNFEGEGPVIKVLNGQNNGLTLESRKRQSGKEDNSCSRQSTNSVAKIVESKDDLNEVSDTGTEELEEIMEEEYLNIGSDTIAWLKKYKKYPELVANILETSGLSLHRCKLKKEDCDLVVEMLSHCSELKKFRFTFSKSLETMLAALVKAKSDGKTLPEITTIHFSGYSCIDKVLSDQFVECVKLFNAVGLVLASVKASFDDLQCLRTALKRLKEGGCFSTLEIFHNRNIGHKGWVCLADIAKDFSEVPLRLSTCYCDVTDKQLVTFKKALGQTKLGKIDVCGNRKLTKKGFQIIGEIVKVSEVPSVTLQDCDLNVEKVRAFNTGCGIDETSKESPSTRIVSLNIANNPRLGEEKATEIEKAVQRFQVKNLNIASCRLANVTLDHEFESLDISGNSQCTSIAKLATSAKQRLYLRNCILYTSELMAIGDEMKENKRKLEEIDVTDESRQIDPSFIDFMVEQFKDVTTHITFADNITIPTSEKF